MSAGAGARSVSVVIATFNQSNFLEEAVDSALRQTHGRPQIIIVDDGSTDDTPRVAERLNAVFVRQANRGPSAARNAGLSLATGEFVVFLDGDDKLDPRHNELCVAALEAHHEAGYAYSQWQRFGASEDISDHPDFSRSELLYRNYVHVASLFRREVLKEVGFDERLRWGMEDWDLYLSLLHRGQIGVRVDLPLLLYRDQGSGRTARLEHRATMLHGVHFYLLVKHRRLYGARGFVSRLRLLRSWAWQDCRRYWQRARDDIRQ